MGSINAKLEFLTQDFTESVQESLQGKSYDHLAAQVSSKLDNQIDVAYDDFITKIVRLIKEDSKNSK